MTSEYSPPGDSHLRRTRTGDCRRLSRRIAVLLLACVFCPRPASAVDHGESFLRDGDRWLFVGDSITHADTYRQILLRVLQHYHPRADIMVGNSAVCGVTSDFKETHAFVPTVVTIMLGMNDVIHEDWPFRPDMTAKVEAYRTSMTAKVREYKALGAEVILMTPTYSDERFPAYFNVAMTRRFLEAFGQVVREVAAAEDCHWVPVGEDLEAFQDTLGVDRHVRPDGVHPYGLGQYQIARTLMQRLNVAGALNGVRKLHTPVEPLGLSVRLHERFMHSPADGVTLLLSTPAARDVTATWSLGKERGGETLSITPAGITWRVPVPAEALDLDVGGWRRLVVDFSGAGQSRLCIVDLARTRVLKMAGGKVEGIVTTEQERPEGKTVATWGIEERENELWFSGEVFDSSNDWTAGWPFARDGVQLWLDLRPAERFADINPDRDVSDTLITVREEPFFSVTPVYWIRPRLMYGSVCGGTKTATGYRWHYGVCGNVTDARKTDIRKLDYFGFNVIVCDSDVKPKPGSAYFRAMDIEANDQIKRLNLLMVVDRRGAFPGSETTNLHLWQ